MIIKFKKLHPKAVIPKYAKADDAGADLTAVSYSYENGRHIFGTGLAVEIPKGHVGLIFPRSSICKYDLRLSNAVGVIDAGYRGEIKLFFENDNMYERHVKETPFAMLDGQEMKVYEKQHKIYSAGERIGQLIVMPYPKCDFIEVSELDETERSNGGFGSSGT